MGWEVYEAENGENADALLQRSVRKVLAAAAGTSLGQRRADEVYDAADQNV